MAKIYEIRTAYRGYGYKIRGWRGLPVAPSAGAVADAQARFEVYCDELLYSGPFCYTKAEIAEVVLNDLSLDACEVCDTNDVGVVIYKEWP